MDRRGFLRQAAFGGAGLLAGCASAPSRRVRLEEATLAELRQALSDKVETAVSLTTGYLRRIADLDRNGPALNSVIELNPDALAIARALDAEAPRGPLHGIPVLIKDNIDTHDRMSTTAGSLALEGSIAARDSAVARKLREAGAVILGKTNMSEWANFRHSPSTSGWSGRGGLTKNPYALDRNPSGSSSGSAAAVSAGLCAVAVGTETDGSIVSPSSVCGIVGIKPTVGLINGTGIIPISSSQDTAGPMARSVADAALLLGVLAEERKDYAASLAVDGLRGARLGVSRKHFRPGSIADRLLDEAIAVLRREGAVVVDPAELPTHGTFGGAEHEVLLHEFKAGLNAYLGSLGSGAAVHSLEELIAFNEKNKSREMPYFGQDLLIRAQAKGPLTEPLYQDALKRCRRLSRADGIDALMTQQRLDAIVAPTAGPAAKTDLVYGNRDLGGSSGPAAVAGYPSITVPMGISFGLPVGISFFGRAWSEALLIKIAYAFEQATKARVTPRLLPSLG